MLALVAAAPVERVAARLTARQLHVEHVVGTGEAAERFAHLPAHCC